jgi:hypothetical protein
VVVQPLLGGFDPGFEPVTFPAHRLDQHDPGSLYEQNAQLAITASGHLAEDRAVAGRDLLRCKAKLRSEVAALSECFPAPDRGHHRAGDDRSDTGDAHQPFTTFVLPGERSNLAG